MYWVSIRVRNLILKSAFVNMNSGDENSLHGCIAILENCKKKIMIRIQVFYCKSHDVRIIFISIYPTESELLCIKKDAYIRMLMLAPFIIVKN